MLYVYYGSDEKRARSKARMTIAALQKKAPQAHEQRITTDDAEEVDIAELIASQGLFYPKRIVLFDNVLSERDVRERLFAQLTALTKSEHAFVLLERTLHQAHEKKLKAAANTMERYDVATSAQKQNNDFALANAYGAGNRARMWAEYHRALTSGAAPEALHGMLFWKAKQMLMQPTSSTHEKVVRTQVATLATLPSEARRRGVELEYALEQFLLTTQ